MVPSRRATACHRRARWQASWAWRAPPSSKPSSGWWAGGCWGGGGGAGPPAATPRPRGGGRGGGAGTQVSQAVHAGVAPVDAPLDIESIASAKLTQAIAIAKHFGSRLVHKYQPFTTGTPAFDAFPMAQWLRLSGKYWRNSRSP